MCPLSSTVGLTLEMTTLQSAAQMLVGSMSHPESVWELWAICMPVWVCLSVWCTPACIHVCLCQHLHMGAYVSPCVWVYYEWKRVWHEDQSPFITPQSASQSVGQPVYWQEAPRTAGDVELRDSEHFNENSVIQLVTNSRFASSYHFLTLFTTSL